MSSTTTITATATKTTTSLKTEQGSGKGPESTTATLSFLVPPADPSTVLYAYTTPVPGEPQRNYTHEEKQVQIENLRGKEDSVSLDKTGFQFFTEPSVTTPETFDDDKEVERVYYPESVEIIKKLTGASKVVVFDHTIRRRVPGQTDSTPSTRQPVSQAHVDQTTKAATARVHRHLPADEVPALLKKRYQIINLWRPISHPALDWPLALCDHRSVDSAPGKDTAPVQLRFPDRVGETMGIKYNPNQRWKYLYGMRPDEGVLIKCSDSVLDGSVAVFTPHTGFDDPATPKGSAPRQSIELRTLVFYD